MFLRRISYDRMPDKTMKTLRRLSTEDLMRFIAGWREGTEDWLKGQVELRRRENWTARAALIISVVALIVAAVRP